MTMSISSRASNGKILEADRDAGKVSAPKDTKTEQPAKSETTSSGDGISLKEAKNLALKHAGISSSEATFVKAKKDYEDGIQVYEIEFYSGNTEYDYEIRVSNGEIISYDKDIENYSIPSKNSGSSQTPSSNYIGADKAKSIALKRCRSFVLFRYFHKSKT